MIIFKKPLCLICKKSCRRREHKFCSRECSDKGRITFRRSATEEQILDRLKKSYESKVIRNGIDECWGWKNKLDNGYGMIANGYSKVKAHRASWIIHNGMIPIGKFICHTCDNRKCTNPSHLFIGTHYENMKDMVNKGRQKGSIGSNAWNARISEEQVYKIKELLKINNPTKIAIDLNINRHIIYSIKYGTTWKHVKASLVNQL